MKDSGMKSMCWQCGVETKTEHKPVMWPGIVSGYNKVCAVCGKTKLGGV